MVFVDETRIFVKAGGGGKGCESFYRDKYMRYPVPDGGDGGDGGDVIFVADKRIHTLLDYRYKQHYEGERGGHASSKGKKGRTGQDCILKVPLGTIIRDHENQLLIKDLVKDGQTVVVAKGGDGGKGNKRRKIVIPPNLGQEKVIHLELKIVADVGIVGFPNAGKSTLITKVSKVRSKIANYPFTTRQPILGVVQDGEEQDFVIADLPGLIEGAHKGRGLGDRFLKHAERTRVLLHMIDMSGSEGRDPLDDFEKIEIELESYSDNFLLKKKILVANKMDLEPAAENLKRFKKRFKQPILAISALAEEGLAPLLKKIRQNLK